MAFPPLPTGRRIGFWVSDDDIYSGDPVFGNAAGTPPTPQQFFNAYFQTSPFPASMIWVGGLQSSSAHAVPPAQEAQWFNQLLQLCDAHPNVRIWMIAFLNLSGNSIEGAQFAPGLSTGFVNPPDPTNLNKPSFTLRRQSPLTIFTVTAAAGLAPNTTFTLQLLDNSLKLIANITTLTTDATGAGSVTAAIPNTTDAQANAGGLIVFQGTHVGVGVGWQNDQTVDFTAYMQAIAGHSSFVGVLFEPEYFGNNAQIQATFKNIVNGVNYYVLGSLNSPSTGDAVMRYSSYPYFGGQLQKGTSPAGELGVHYGETGGPIPPDPQPIWTQAAVTNIVDNSEVTPITIVISVNDTNNPAGNTYLYMRPTLRGWIANDPNYASFLQSGPVSGPTSTTLSLTARVV